MVERTLVLIKPDAIANGFAGSIITRFLENGFQELKQLWVFPTADMIEEHYHNVFSRHPEYRESVTKYMTSGSFLAFVFERENAIKEARRLVGPLTNAPPGTIRGDYRSDQSDALHTVVHASDSPEAAQNEIALWFPELANPC